MSIYNNKIKYISGEPGTGKGNHIKRECKTGRNVIVQPTIELLNEFTRGMLNVKVLHSDSCAGELLSAINMELANENDSTIAITDKMFYRIERHRLRGWRIFIDDCLSFNNMIARNKRDDNIESVYNKLFIVGEYIEIDGEGGELDHMYRYFDMCPRENVSDDMLPVWEMYNQLSMFHRRGILDKSLSQDFDKIIVWGDYDIPAYADELDMTYCANQFEHSTLYKAHGEKFQKIEYTKTHWQNDNNKRVVMNYFVPDTKSGLSKKIMKTSTDIFTIQNWILNNVPKYYWAKNDDVEISFSIGNDDEHKKISVNQRGINSLMTYENCVFMAAMNPSDVVVQHYDNIWGITKADLINEWTYETLNQFIYRGVIRDYSTDTPMNVYVYDETTARTFTGAGEYRHIDLGLTDNRKLAGRSRGSTKYDGEDKVLDARFRKWKNKNSTKPNVKYLFAKWRHKQEQHAEVAGLDWNKQLNRYSDLFR